MLANQNSFRGVVDGNVIRLDSDAGLPNGQAVTVFVEPIVQPAKAPGKGIVSSAGAWGDDAQGVDAFLEQTRRARQLDSTRLTNDAVDAPEAEA